MDVHIDIHMGKLDLNVKCHLSVTTLNQAIGFQLTNMSHRQPGVCLMLSCWCPTSPWCQGPAPSWLGCQNVVQWQSHVVTKRVEKFVAIKTSVLIRWWHSFLIWCMGHVGACCCWHNFASFTDRNLLNEYRLLARRDDVCFAVAVRSLSICGN